MSEVIVDANPECPVCLQPCIQPVQLPCTHIFCFLCLKGFAYRRNRCAICRDVIELEYFSNPTVVNVVCDKDGIHENIKHTTATHDTYDWFYEGHRETWWKYDERATKTLEKTFSESHSDENHCELLISGFSYIIDFEKMIQFRKSNPSRIRRVKRDISCNVEYKGVAGLRSTTAIHQSNTSTGPFTQSNNDTEKSNDNNSSTYALNEQNVLISDNILLNNASVEQLDTYSTDLVTQSTSASVNEITNSIQQALDLSQE